MQPQFSVLVYLTWLKLIGIGLQTLRHLFDLEHLEAAEAKYSNLIKKATTGMSFLYASYPNYLKHCIDSPLRLLQKGNQDLGQHKIISVVTRNITSYGMAFCAQVIADLAPLNPIIFSGFAYGVGICI